MVDRIIRKLADLAEYFSVILLVIMVLDICYCVVLRYIFSQSPIWGEEIARLCMVYICFYGFSVGIRYDTHIKVTMFDKLLPAWAIRLSDYFTLILLLGVSIFLIIEGINLCIVGQKNIMVGLKIPSSILMSCIPIGSFLNIFQILYRLKEVH